MILYIGQDNLSLKSNHFLECISMCKRCFIEVNEHNVDFADTSEYTQGLYNFCSHAYQRKHTCIPCIAI